MKRKNLFTAALITCGISLAACSGTENTNSEQTTNSDAEAQITALQKQVEELEKENESLRSQTDAAEQEKQQEEVATEEPQNSTSTAIKKGDVITTDSMEITIKNVEFSYDVLPDDTSSFYTHYPADSGKVYIHIDTDVKNLGKQNLSCAKIMGVTADYNGGFTYNSQTVPEDGTTGFTYANITSIAPLETLGVHFLIECPQEVEESDSPLFVTFEPSNSKDTYKLTIR